MKLNKLKETDNALVGIVVTFLLIGLIVSVVSIVQTVYIPKWMQQTESEHMDEVADQFAQLKSAIDIQGTIGTMQPVHTPISTAITLGSRELPFLKSTRAFGSLGILSDTSYRVVITGKNGEISDNSSARSSTPHQTRISSTSRISLRQERWFSVNPRETSS